MKIHAFYDRKDIFGNRQFQEDIVDVDDYGIGFNKHIRSALALARKTGPYTDYSFRFETYKGDQVQYSVNVETKAYDGDIANDVFTVSVWEYLKGRDDEKKMSKAAVIALLKTYYDIEKQYNQSDDD